MTSNSSNYNEAESNVMEFEKGGDRVGALYLDCFNEQQKCLTLIGGGKMAFALARGFVSAGCFDSADVFVCTKSEGTAQSWRKNGYPNAFASKEFYTKIKKPRGLVLIAVKPQIFPTFLDEVHKNEWFYFGGPEIFCVSIMAGISLAQFGEKLRSVGYTGHCARLMPNVNCAVNAGTLLVCAAQETPTEMIELLLHLGSLVGYCVRVDESQFNAASSIAGCAPAFIFTVIEALADGGVLCGLGRELATRLAAEMVKGSAKLVLEQESSNGITSPAQLKDQVCSPAGTTIAGIRELERSGVRSAFIEAISASTRRANEMASDEKK